VADFSTPEQIVGGTAISAQSPVEAPRGALAGYAGALDNATSNAMNIFQEDQRIKAIEARDKATNDAAIAKQQAADQTDLASSDLARRQLAISQSVANGEISSAEGRTRMRNILSKAIANDPLSTKELLATHGAIVGGSKMATEVTEGTPKEKQEKEFLDMAAKAGHITPEMSPEQANRVAHSYASFKSEMDSLSLQKSRVSLAASQENLAASKASRQSAQVDLSAKVAQKKALTGLVSMAGDYYDITQTKANAIASSSVLSQEEKMTQLDLLKASTSNEVRKVNQAAPSSTVDDILKPTFDVIQAYQDKVSGVKAAAASDASIKYQTNQVLINGMVSNPKLISLLAAAKIDPTGIATSQNIEAAVQLITNTAMPAPGETPASLPTTGEDAASIQGAVLDNLSQYQTGNHANQAEVGQELSNLISGAVKGAYDPKYQAQHPKELNDFIKFTADPIFGRSQQNPDLVVSKEDGAKAIRAMQSVYDKQVMPLVANEWAAALTGGTTKNVGAGKVPAIVTTGQTPVSSTITAKFLGSSLFFEAPVGETNEHTLGSVDKLNKEVAPLINQLNRSYTHLQGSTNYKSTYEQMFAPLFAPPEVDKSPTVKPQE
jgi:hypothetical protein